MFRFIYSEAGHDHRNEDAVAVQSHPFHSGVLLCALADGQGGQFGGAAASQTAVKQRLEVASSHSAKQLAQAATWRTILSTADSAVSYDANAGYTTLIGLSIEENRLTGASCGDSAVLLINQGKPTLLTENQRKNPPVGSGAAIPVAFSARLDSGFKVLVVSDGVWKYMGWDAIINLCAQKQGDELIAVLRELAVAQSSGKLPDDFTIALLQ